MSSTTTSPIPLHEIPRLQQRRASEQSPIGSSAAPPIPPASGGSSNTSTPRHSSAQDRTPTATSQPSLLPSFANRLPTWKEKFANACSFAHGIGTFALLAAIIFGIGAWVGMKIQISQGDKSMELAIWTACADHEAIQNSQVCRSIMAKNFSELVTRENGAEDSKTMTSVTKRLEASDELRETMQEGESPREVSRLSKLLESLSDSEQQLIVPKAHDLFDDYAPSQADPAIRATILPLVDLLTKPITWILSLVESFFLIIIYCMHRAFSWTTYIILYVIQGLIYSFVENMVHGFVASLDDYICAILPALMPSFLTGNVISCLGMTALQSYWYGTSYLVSLKSILFFRIGLWFFVKAVALCVQAWTAWRDTVDRRRMQQNPASHPPYLQYLNAFLNSKVDYGNRPRNQELSTFTTDPMLHTGMDDFLD